MRRASIVPVGFEVSAHPVFFSFVPPPVELFIIDQRVTQEVVVVTTAATTASTQQQTCPICLQIFDNPVTLTGCHHSFCMECLLAWFRTRKACPLCNNESTYCVSRRGSIWALWNTSTGSRDNTLTLDDDAVKTTMTVHAALAVVSLDDPTVATTIDNPMIATTADEPSEEKSAQQQQEQRAKDTTEDKQEGQLRGYGDTTKGRVSKRAGDVARHASPLSIEQRKKTKR